MTVTKQIRFCVRGYWCFLIDGLPEIRAIPFIIRASVHHNKRRKIIIIFNGGVKD